MTSANSPIHAMWKSKLLSEPTGYVIDGVLDATLYANSTKKICFLCKEANYQGKEMVDSAKWYKDGGFGQFSSRLQEWAAGMRYNFPPIAELNNKHKTFALKSAAIVNVKKTGGLGRADDSVIAEHAGKYRELLHQQLQELHPDCIVLGLTTRQTRDAAFPEVKWFSSGYHCDVAKWQDIILIDFYHPSSRNAPAAAYSLLQNIVRSVQFESLLGKKWGVEC